MLLAAALSQEPSCEEELGLVDRKKAQTDGLLNVKSSVSLMCCGLSRPGKESKTFQALRFLMC